jgi:hypothetical protein
MNRILLLFLTFALMISGPASAQNKTALPSEKTTKATGLELPSFSIFGWSSSTAPNEVDKPFSPDELERFLAEREKYKAEDNTAKPEELYFIIPVVFYKSRHLFSKESWTAEEIEQGQQISDFFAKLTGKDELKIKGTGQVTFSEGLVRLRDWFASMCRDNKTLASMIFTLDDGPFLGFNLDINEYPKLRLLESEAIPGAKASFVLMADWTRPDPMIIGVLNEDKSVRWLKRFSNAPRGRIIEAELQKPAVHKLEGYGYVIALMTDGTSGRERSSVYLDESLNLRFFYVSW